MSGLHVKGVTVTIKEDRILDNVSFSLEPGVITALVGHNGAGKSTLMKTILGWQEKKSGIITLSGIDQDQHFISFKQNLSYIPEEPFLLSELTSMQHFQLYGQSYQIDEQKFNQLVEYYIGELEIKDKLHEFPESLSKGMRQKVQTICALLPDVDLLLIDEPFMGLDIYASEFLEKIIKEKAKQGTAILLTSHQLERVKELANQYLMLKQGRMIDQGVIGDFNVLKRRFD
ncbi:ABC transporter ATP-binding protein [Aquibacillus rhizosphaerae]|uniref:ABC transporter ATP-binding protein n=1 Tax=Aquibacillus rhizosphaerae TaxID=3051431 RepID=A0ABT7L2P0_9BACI|nr:ABC transporter ATP-binding protein [Aquibacillus sp. LR5S19]MDL4840136.1 ABC transporter ATP-binding protein [Aquibacillus sp. LR5S19]